MAEKRDAGAASLKKVPTDMIVARVRAQLKLLDEVLHAAKLEAQNTHWDAGHPLLEKTVDIGANLAAHAEELRVRVKRGW